MNILKILEIGIEKFICFSSFSSLMAPFYYPFIMELQSRHLEAATW